MSPGCVGRARSVWATLGLSPLKVTVLPGPPLLRLPGCSAGELSKVFHTVFLGYSTRTQSRLGMRFVSFPGPSSSGNQLFGERIVPGGPCVLITSPVPAARFPRRAPRALSQVCRVSPLGSWSRAATLLADVNRLGSQDNVVSSWEPAHSLVEDAGPWGWDCLLPSGSGRHTPASLPRAGGGGGALYPAG